VAQVNADKMKISKRKRELLEELAALQQVQINTDILIGVAIEELHEEDATPEELEEFKVRELFFEYIYK